MNKMILVGLMILTSSQVLAASDEASQLIEDQKKPVSSILRKTTGIAIRPSIHRWRKSSLSLKLEYGQISELNNYDSEHVTILAEVPGETFSYQIGVRRVVVATTESADSLAKTPFKQPGHASRFEIVTGLKAPIHEGIGSQLFNLIPQAQMVVSGLLRLNFHQYLDATNNENPLDILKNQFKPEIGGDEYQGILDRAHGAMLPSRSRHSIGLGLVLDHYYPVLEGQAIVVTASVLMMTDVHQDEASLSKWLEYNLGVGYDF
ncbi:hypothetical protein [Pseudobacteriovorax antillogorgiicola]|uniref:Uncharacterized protein n=1 Tax=Pseudobacteriovorax antillogorgiicola TaxID=1513793 RepID=A0A1Y6CR62_9BACT|nr:hypothetical protein [Pseudobacteriovorax antillogorgiicola]TCS45909.1 hypothetical protein EDD56_12672 [Pseudobacteriovorax antillogorgiicola]SMF71092.1 hypothetical protein SAMN06296036_12626 [Pseudobacteriovorax antillogorgiicola]